MRKSSLTFNYLCSYKCNTLNAKEVILLMKTSRIIYKGNLRTEATHIRSGQTILTDAPVDNNGKGEAFSPTDLLATSLGNCMLTIMGIVGGRHQLSIEGTSVEITKIMAENPRRVAEIIVEFSMPSNGYSPADK